MIISISPEITRLKLIFRRVIFKFTKPKYIVCLIIRFNMDIYDHISFK